MVRKRPGDLLAGLLLAAAMCYLIFQGKAALEAAQEGISLCLKRVIPSLFPFFVLSRLAAGSSLANDLARVLGPILERVYHLPGSGATALVLGALGGYPTGAQVAADLKTRGRLTAREAERLLAFCSNCSPGFVFGMLGCVFGISGAGVLYCAHLIAATITGFFLRSREAPCHKAPTMGASVPIPQAVGGALRAMGSVCAYVVLFSILTDALARGGQGFLPDSLLLVLQGLLELTGGFAALSAQTPDVLHFCMAGFFLSFGGLCVWFQTKSILAPAGLTGQWYLPGKLLQGGITAALAFLSAKLFPGLLTVETAAMGNHHGLLGATAWVAGSFLLFFLLFVLYSRKKAGKTQRDAL